MCCFSVKLEILGKFCFISTSFVQTIISGYFVVYVTGTSSSWIFLITLNVGKCDFNHGRLLLESFYSIFVTI